MGIAYVCDLHPALGAASTAFQVLMGLGWDELKLTHRFARVTRLISK